MARTTLALLSLALYLSATPLVTAAPIASPGLRETFHEIKAKITGDSTQKEAQVQTGTFSGTKPNEVPSVNDVATPEQVPATTLQRRLHDDEEVANLDPETSSSFDSVSQDIDEGLDTPSEEDTSAESSDMDIEDSDTADITEITNEEEDEQLESDLSSEDENNDIQKRQSGTLDEEEEEEEELTDTEPRFGRQSFAKEPVETDEDVEDNAEEDDVPEEIEDKEPIDSPSRVQGRPSRTRSSDVPTVTVGDDDLLNRWA